MFDSLTYEDVHDLIINYIIMIIIHLIVFCLSDIGDYKIMTVLIYDLMDIS